MINNFIKHNKKFSNFFLAHLCLTTVLLLWFMPVTGAWCRVLDNSIFLTLNKSLENHYFWQWLWGCLNHKHESWLNLVVMLSINGLIIYKIPAKQQLSVATEFVYYWVFFQLALITSHVIFRDILQLSRPSPSLVLEPFVKLSLRFNDSAIKDASNNCFPSGHVFVLVYWALFSVRNLSKLTQFSLLITTTFFCLPRLFSGGHWFSDIIFSIIFAWQWYIYANLMPWRQQCLLAIHKGLHKCFFAKPPMLSPSTK